VGSAEVKSLQFSAEAVQWQVTVWHRGRKPVPDDWSLWRQSFVGIGRCWHWL